MFTFFKNLFKKKDKRTILEKQLDHLSSKLEQENIEDTRSLNKTINGFFHILGFNAAELLKDQTKYTITGIPGEHNLHAIPNPRNPEVEVFVPVGEFMVNAFKGVVISFSYKGLSTHVSIDFAAASTEEDVKKYVEFLDYLAEKIGNQDILKGSAFEINIKKTFFGNFYEFVQMTVKKNSKIILNPEVDYAVNSFIIQNIGNDKKELYLLTGNYGNGKTETALNIGKSAIEAGKCFYYVRKTEDLKDILQTFSTLNLLNISVFFAEDVDQILGGSSRDSSVNGILNIIDGAMSKNTGVKIILTTNHQDKLNPALRRPGRIDVIVEFSAPNMETTEKILSSLILDKKNLDFPLLTEYLFKTLQNPSGAVIAQTCSRMNKVDVLDMDSAKFCVDSMLPQVLFMKDDVEKTPYEELVETLSRGFIGRHL